MYILYVCAMYNVQTKIFKRKSLFATLSTTEHLSHLIKINFYLMLHPNFAFKVSIRIIVHLLLGSSHSLSLSLFFLEMFYFLSIVIVVTFVPCVNLNVQIRLISEIKLKIHTSNIQLAIVIFFLIASCRMQQCVSKCFWI